MELLLLLLIILLQLGTGTRGRQEGYYPITCRLPHTQPQSCPLLPGRREFGGRGERWWCY